MLVSPLRQLFTASKTRARSVLTDLHLKKNAELSLWQKEDGMKDIPWSQQSFTEPLQWNELHLFGGL